MNIRTISTLTIFSFYSISAMEPGTIGNQLNQPTHLADQPIKTILTSSDTRKRTASFRLLSHTSNKEAVTKLWQAHNFFTRGQASADGKDKHKLYKLALAGYLTSANNFLSTAFYKTTDQPDYQAIVNCVQKAQEIQQSIYDVVKALQSEVGKDAIVLKDRKDIIELCCKITKSRTMMHGKELQYNYNKQMAVKHETDGDNTLETLGQLPKTKDEKAKLIQQAYDSFNNAAHCFISASKYTNSEDRILMLDNAQQTFNKSFVLIVKYPSHFDPIKKQRYYEINILWCQAYPEVKDDWEKDGKAWRGRIIMPNLPKKRSNSF